MPQEPDELIHMRTGAQWTNRVPDKDFAKHTTAIYVN